MKVLLIAAMIAAAPGLALAQTKPAPKAGAAASKPTAKATTKSNSKAPAKKAKTSTAGKSSTNARRKTPADAAAEARERLRSNASQLAAGQRAVDRALTPDELALAEQVQVGRMPCELGNVVVLAADPKSPGHFDLEMQKARYRMVPVRTSTGAIRLEDEQAGAVWLQLANKSMLMNTKLGQRMADDCQSPEQTTVAEGMKRAPPTPSLLDGVPAGSIETIAPKR